MAGEPEDEKEEEEEKTLFAWFIIDFSAGRPFKTIHHQTRPAPGLLKAFNMFFLQFSWFHAIVPEHPSGRGSCLSLLRPALVVMNDLCRLVWPVPYSTHDLQLHSLFSASWGLKLTIREDEEEGMKEITKSSRDAGRRR